MIEKPIREKTEPQPPMVTSQPGSTGWRRELLDGLLALPLIAIIGLALLGLWWTVIQPRPIFLLIRDAYRILTIILPAVLLLVGLPGWLLARRDERRWPRRLALAWLAGAALLVGARVYATHIEPHRLQVRRITIASEKITAPLRVLHVSDIQSDRVGRYDERAFATMHALKPDLVIHTGDMLHTHDIDGEWRRLAALWDTLQPPQGKLNIFGTVDEPLRDIFSRGEGGLRTLENEEVTITAPGARLRVLGLSNDFSANHPGNDDGVRARVQQWLANAGPQDFNLLLGHQPDFLHSVHDLPIDLCLAGHVHGGQVRLPFIGPIVTMTTIPRRLAMGLHTWDKVKFNVSAGMGSEHIYGLPDLRVNCPPEITLIELIPA